MKKAEANARAEEARTERAKLERDKPDVSRRNQFVGAEDESPSPRRVLAFHEIKPTERQPREALSGSHGPLPQLPQDARGGKA